MKACHYGLVIIRKLFITTDLHARVENQTNVQMVSTIDEADEHEENTSNLVV
jgi:hypothetical protein